MMHPTHLIFYLMLVMGTLLSLSANSWFVAWLGMEMNLVGFIPLLIKKNNIKSAEAAMKYFFVQGASSSLLIIVTLNSLMSLTYSNLALLALMVKVGAAPCHFWIPSMAESLSWANMLILLTWQKINPLFLMLNLNSNSFMPFIFSSLVFGSIGGYNQTSMKKILAFSSIAHLAWILAAAKMNAKLMSNYLSIYILTLIALTSMLSKKDITDINKTGLLDAPSKINMYIMMLSLGGMPPLLGFFPKIMVILTLINNSFMILPLSLIMSSVINLYFYLRMTYTTMAVQTIKQLSKKAPTPLMWMTVVLSGPILLAGI